MTNDNNEVEETLDLPQVEETEEDTTDWKAEATKLQQKAIRQREKTKELKAKNAELEAKVPKEEPKSNEPDYSKLTLKTFLKGEGVSHPDDQKMVLQEAERLKLPVDAVIEMEHIKSRLKNASDQREAAEGMPTNGTPGSGASKNSVEHHLAKGTTPDDQETAEKVIDARMQKEKSGNKFSEELYS